MGLLYVGVLTCLHHELMGGSASERCSAAAQRGKEGWACAEGCVLYPTGKSKGESDWGELLTDSIGCPSYGRHQTLFAEVKNDACEDGFCS